MMKTIIKLILVVGMILGAVNVYAAKYRNDNVWMHAGDWNGVSVYWRFRQELSDQFIAELKFENHNPYKVSVSFKSEFYCPNGSGPVVDSGQEVDIKAGATVGGQWAGLFWYPCPGVPPSRGGYQNMIVKRQD